MADIVVDSSVVLAVLLGEPGGDAATDLIENSTISAVNLAEVVTRLVDSGWPEDETRASIDRLALTVVAFVRPLGFATGLLRSATRRRGLSLGDRACLATARQLGLPVLTCDTAWSEVDVGVEVRQAR